MTAAITDLYCEGVSSPIPWAGTAYEFEERRMQARSDAGRHGKLAMVLAWDLNGRKVVLDLNRTRVIAMVERWAPAP